MTEISPLKIAGISTGTLALLALLYFLSYGPVLDHGVTQILNNSGHHPKGTWTGAVAVRMLMTVYLPIPWLGKKGLLPDVYERYLDYWAHGQPTGLQKHSVKMR